jgi:sugar lactone lactonase YvrE
MERYGLFPELPSRINMSINPYVTRLLGIGLLAMMVWPTWADSGRGRNRKLYAVPAGTTVVVDGKLDDWDWSGHIESYEQVETRDSQRAEFVVMYDADALYVAAKIKDVSPMMNRHNPAADADKAWMGDCCQFRLVTDRRQPFPYLSGSLGSKDAMGVEVAQPIHLTLWYFTDNKEPALQLFKSFALQPIRPEWGTHGVVPHDQFAAAYRTDDDGKGFTFEYRIPWETLSAKTNHPVAGDIATATVQFLWGDERGLVNKGCAYDLMSQPGFPWQESGCWGKLIFADKGAIPRSWVDPYVKPTPPQPLTFTYDLPADGETSVALFDKDNRIVRHMAAQAPRKAGPVTEVWDGRDSTGKPLPAGDYTWKGLYHAPIQTRHVMSIGNSGQPPWKTADGTGGWGGDYGPPTAATVAGDTLILGWTGHEAGWGIIATDLAGKKKWGLGHKNAALLATDGTRFFAPGEEGGKQINVYAVATGQPLAFGNGRQGLQAPAGGDEKTDRPTGVAFDRGVIHVSFAARNLIGLYDALSGDLKTSWAVEKPGRLAVAADGTLLAISGKTVVRMVDGKAAGFAADHLDVPVGIAVDTQGVVFVSNHGALHNVSVFTAAGKYQRSIGRAGGRPVVGAFDPKGMREPAGIAVDGQGKLWVPESAISMKRISVWDTKTGKLLNEFFGGCSYSPFAWIDPENPKEAFFDNTIWKIDLDKGTWYPKSIFYARKSANSLEVGNGGFFWPFRVFTARNGRQYAVGGVYAFGSALWLREGDRMRPVHFMFRNHPNPVLMPRPPFPVMDDKKVYPPGRQYVWSDANTDQEAQTNELAEISGNAPFFQWMDADLNLYADGAVYRPTAIARDGVPSYDFTKPQRITPAPAGLTWVDPQAKALWAWRDGNDLSLYRPDGTLAWVYPGLRNWHSTINVGSPKPGTLWGATCPVGVVGRFSGLVSYFGTVDLVRDDGLFVAQVFEHPAKGNNGPNIFYIEFLAGQMVQPKGTGKTYLLAGDQDCRVSEVIGLDSVRDLRGGVYQYTPAMAEQAAKAWADYQAKAAGGQALVLARGGEAGLAVADPVGRVVDDKRGFQVQAAYDATHLYFRYTVTSPATLTNAMTDPQTIYKGGNLLDIQVATDVAADPKRTKPAAGDVRLLVSRRDGKPWAALLRPKVAGFTGQPITLTSPTGSETFDSIAVTDRVVLRNLRQTPQGFEVTAVVPLELLGLGGLKAGSEVRLDVGYIFGDVGGVNAAVRAYWHNNSFTANVVNDIPHESRLEPAEWGQARVE